MGKNKKLISVLITCSIVIKNLLSKWKLVYLGMRILKLNESFRQIDTLENCDDNRVLAVFHLSLAIPGHITVYAYLSVHLWIFMLGQQ